MSLSDEDLAIMAQDTFCGDYVTPKMIQAFEELQSLRASQAKVVEALWNLLDASDDSDSAYREELLDAARSRARAILIDGEKEGK